jgi:hypothetical protein
MDVRLASIVCAVDFPAASLKAVGFALDLARLMMIKRTLKPPQKAATRSPPW